MSEVARCVQTLDDALAPCTSFNFYRSIAAAGVPGL